MAQYPKGNPWGRQAVGLGQAVLSQGVAGVYPQASIYGANFGQPTFGQQAALLQTPGGQTQYVQSAASSMVAYPATTQRQSDANKQRVFTGTVTKMHDNFGFVDDDVFFQLSACKGGVPKIRDRVLVEAQFNPNMPFKWNATRVQVISVQPEPMATRPMPTSARESRMTAGISGGGCGQSFGESRRQRSRSREAVRRRSPLPPPRRRRSRSRSYSPTSTVHSSRRSRSRSRSRGRPKPLPRYNVQIPRGPLALTSATVNTLQTRYQNLYVPSDFFSMTASWLQSFPLDRAFQLGHPCAYHVFNREIEPPGTPHVSNIDPSDADYKFSAKVLLIAGLSLDELYRKTCSLAQDPTDVRDNFQHPSRLISFLVGSKGKVSQEPMAIGGPWSPSLDGPNPDSDPSVLIKTAIRTTKALIGFDLSGCTQWYRLAEIRYLRPEETKKDGRIIREHIESVVIFLPDIWSCVPSPQLWGTLAERYEKALQHQIAVIKGEIPVGESLRLNGQSPEEASAATTAVPDAVSAPAVASSSKTTPSTTAKQSETPTKTSTTATMDEESSAQPSKDGQKEPAAVASVLPWQQLEAALKTMKVSELRAELEARGLDSKGLKAQLVARLQKVCEDEKQAAENAVTDTAAADSNGTDQMEEDDKVKDEVVDETPDDADDDKMDEGNDDELAEEKKEEAQPDPEKERERKREEERKEREKKREEEDRKKKQERDIALYTRRYALPDEASILVHPNPNAKSGKYDCAVVPLSALLDYGSTDIKEHTFELYLCAELFNEMLARDCGFKIYKAFCRAPDPVKIAALQKKAEEEKKAAKEAEGATKAEAENNENEDAMDESQSGEEPDTKKVKLEESAGADDGADEKKSTSRKSDDEKRDRRTSRHRSRSRSRTRKRSRSSGRSHRRHRSHSSDKRRSTAAEKPKFETVDADLLFACVYFDQSHCDYLMERDVESMFHALNLCLSRSQIRRLMQKVITRDTFNYRKVTDKQVVATQSADTPPATAAATTTDTAATGKVVEDVDDGSFKCSDSDLASGNTKWLEQSDLGERTSAQKPPNSDIVTFRGAVIDVGNLIDRLEQSEQIRVASECKAKRAEEELGEIKSKLRSADKKGDRLTDELKSMKKRYTEQVEKNEQAKTSLDRYTTLLKELRTRADSQIRYINDLIGCDTPKSRADSRATSSEKKPREAKDSPKKEVKEAAVATNSTSLKLEAKSPEDNKTKEESKQKPIKSDSNQSSDSAKASSTANAADDNNDDGDIEMIDDFEVKDEIAAEGFVERVSELLKNSVVDVQFYDILDAIVKSEPLVELPLRGNNPVTAAEVVRAAYSEFHTIIAWTQRMPFFNTFSLEDRNCLLRACFMDLSCARLAYRSLRGGEGKIFFSPDLKLTADECIALGFSSTAIHPMVNFIEKMKSLGVDEIEFYCLQCILLTYPVTTGISSTETVRSVFQKYLDVLRIYTKSVYPEFPTKAPNLLMLLPSLRSLAVQAASAYIKIALFDRSVEVDPVVAELITSAIKP